MSFGKEIQFTVQIQDNIYYITDNLLKYYCLQNIKTNNLLENYVYLQKKIQKNKVPKFYFTCINFNNQFYSLIINMSFAKIITQNKDDFNDYILKLVQ